MTPEDMDTLTSLGLSDYIHRAEDVHPKSSLNQQRRMQMINYPTTFREHRQITWIKWSVIVASALILAITTCLAG